VEETISGPPLERRGHNEIVMLRNQYSPIFAAMQHAHLFQCETPPRVLAEVIGPKRQ